MTYNELKKFDLMSISNREEFENFKKQILESENDDILKYINFLHYQQYNVISDIKYIKRIVNLLSENEFREIEYNNKNLTGDVEDLIIEVEETKEEILKNPISIKAPSFQLDGHILSLLKDDFENILIVKIKDELKVYGYIQHNSTNYVYELPEKNQEYIQSIINAEVGTKVNIKSHYQDEDVLHKTFDKIELEDDMFSDEIFTITRKSPLGILSNVNSGSYTLLKSQTLISSETLLKGIIEDMRKELEEKYNVVIEKIQKKYQKAMNEVAKNTIETSSTNVPEKKKENIFHEQIMDIFLDKEEIIIEEKDKIDIADVKIDGEKHDCSCGDDCKCDDKSIVDKVKDLSKKAKDLFKKK